MKEELMVAQGGPDRNVESATLETRVREALSRAAELGADAAEATASLQGGQSVTVRLGEVETIEHHRDRGITVTVFLGESKGHASSADLRPDSVAACVERAVDIARFTEGDPFNGLADPDRLAVDIPDLDLWHPHELTPDEAIDRALDIESAGRTDDRITNSEGASVSTSFGLAVYGNSNGFLGRSDGTKFGQSCVLIAGNGNGMQRDYWWDSQRRFDDLEAAAATGERAAERTLRRLGATKIPTRDAPVLFAPEVARGLVGHFLGGIAGQALYRNASFLKDTLGQQLFPEWLTLVERPLLPRGPGSAAFDAEGVATQERSIVEEGVLRGYVLSSYSARRLGMETTGNAGGVHNLRFANATMPLDDIMAGMGEGLLVTEVMGQGVSMVTGDYSRGAAGFWVQDGKLSHPVEEVTIAGNLKDVFRSIRAVGDDVDDRGNIQTGSIWVERMTIAGS